MKIALAQCDPLVGDIPGNADLICRLASKAADEGVDLIVYGELTLTGYPPEDLLLRDSLAPRIELALQQVAEVSHKIGLVIGYPVVENGQLFNVAAIWWLGTCQVIYKKRFLPNYQVFDEERYFTAGNQAQVFDFKGIKLGLTVCEDIWFDEPVFDSIKSGADVIINLNASPFHQGKQGERLYRVQDIARRAAVPIIYVNQVGGQDELVFDGGSFAVTAAGSVCYRLERWVEQVGILDLEVLSGQSAMPMHENFNDESLADLYQALVTGVRDYVNKNGFPGVVLGLSGGIDSALTLAIAVDALGADRVRAVMMPFRYTADISQNDAKQQAETMQVQYQSTGIEPMYDAFMTALADDFVGTERDTTEENLQSRCRGVLLMALSNKTGAMVLTTGNKSEMAVGYATLYGDMAGGYAALKDVYKTKVFALAEYRNSVSPVIPQRVIDRPPSAELAPDQVDEDSLPPYPVLDAILEAYIEHDQSAEMLIASGYNRDDVMRVIRLVDINEYKRRQAPIGVRVTKRGFGRDRRYPVCNGWRAGL